MSGSTWKQTLVAVPGVGLSLMPKLICPACWPAYASIVSSLGLGFLVGTTYLLPMTAGLLAMTAGTLAFRARQRRGYGPAWTGSIGAALILLGKFQLDSIITMYTGIGVLLTAAIWNAWPRRIVESQSCPACLPQNMNEHIERRGM
jgi:mercuric ion transport protein